MATENEQPAGGDAVDGHPDGSPTPEPTSEQPATDPIGPRTRRRTWIALAAIAAVGAGTWVTVSTLTDPERQVRAAVTDYLQALEDGDAETAVASIDASLGLGCPEVLTSDAYRDVPDRPTAAVVYDVTVFTGGRNDDDRPAAGVDVVYDRGEGGDARSARIDLVRTSQGWRVIPESELAPAAPPVAPIVGAGELTVDDACSVPGVEVPAVRLLPGSYELGYADPYHLEQARPVQVTLPGTREQTITPVVRPEVADAARTQVLGWITACVDGGWSGPSCEGQEVDVPRYLEPTAGGLVEELGVGFERVPEGGWRFVASAAQDIDGTTVCGPDSGSWCIPDEPTRGTAYFRYGGPAEIAEDGTVTLTREAP